MGKKAFEWSDRVIWKYVQSHSMLKTNMWSKRAIFIGYSYDNPNVAVIMCENQVTKSIARVEHLSLDNEK